MRRLLVILGCLAALGALVGTTLSAFSDQVSNGANSFQAAASWGGVRMASGTYTGNAIDNRAISAGFQPDVVIIKGNTNQVAEARTSTIAGDLSKPLVGGTALSANRIQSLTATGFTIGTNNVVNANGSSYYWVALKADPGVLRVGSYTGDGAASRTLSGFGFSPEYAAVLPANNQRANQRYAGMTSGFRFDADPGNANRISSLNADGFTVGGGNDVNDTGIVYHYIAINEVAGSIDSGSYAGTGASKSVTGLGLQPDYVMLRMGTTGAGGSGGQHRSSAVPGAQSLNYDNVANLTNGITSLLSDGFQVSTDNSVNQTGKTYHYLGLKNDP